jgi:hypothetical protein
VTTLPQRLADADAAVVGRVVAVRQRELEGLPQRVLTIDVDQNVKGGPPKTIAVWTPWGTDCDLTVTPHEDIGLFLTRAPDGRWVATGASLANPGRLVVIAGEPKGSGIKVVVGLVFLGIVLVWALSRRRRGVRPELPGAPRP